MIDLPASRLRVLDCEVDALRRVVTRDTGGRASRLTHKALQVLVALVERRGNVVTRETLFSVVWPDTMPTDDVLTQAITQLRKAFGDDRDAPRYIETIPKVGYRLLAPAEWLHDEPVPAQPGDARPATVALPAMARSAVPATSSAPATPEAAGALGLAGSPGPAPPVAWAQRRRARSPRLVARAAAAVVIACTAAMAVWALRAGDPVAGVTGSPLELGYRALTSTPGQERLPALAPDGATVVFVQATADGGSTLMLQPMAQAAARALTTPAAGQSDTMPVWSRDGTRIAFVRLSAGTCRFMLVAASGGEPRDAGPCLDGAWSQFDWTPDGRGLVMGGTRRPDRPSAPLHRLDLASGRWQPLEYAIGDGDVDQLPRYSPDGRLLVFRRNVSLADLWIMPAQGGTPRPLTRVRGDIRGWDWLPDSSGVVLSHIGGQATLWLLRLSETAMQPLSRLPAGDAVHPDIAADAWSMVFEIDHSRSGLFRARIDGDADGAAPEPVFASSGADMLPALSPDGRTLAFVSSRSMSVQLWLGEVDRPDTLRPVDGLRPVPRHPAVWSDDGRTLLVLGRTDQGDRLFEVDVLSGRIGALAAPSARPVFAAYAGGPDRLLVGADDGRGRVRLVLYARDGWRELAVEDDVALARYDSATSTVLWTRPATPGLWRADALLRGAVRISETLPQPPHYRHWSVHAGRVYSIGPAAGCGALWQPLATPGEPTRQRCISADTLAVGGSPALDARGRWLYLGLPMTQNIDIGAAQLPQPRQGAAKQDRDGWTMAKLMRRPGESMTFGRRTVRCRHEFALVS